MSQITKAWVVATLTSFVMVLSTLGGISAASAAPGDPIIPSAPSCVIELVSGDPATAPPAPTCYDPSGSDLDELLAPLYYDGNGKQVVYHNSESWSPYKWDQPNSTHGAGQVNVGATFFDPSLGYYVERFSWTLAFNTSVTAQPNANAYWVVVGDCKFGGAVPVRPATAYFRNEAGVDGRYVGHVSATTGTNQPVSATRVLEGATVGLPLIVDSSQPGLSASTEQDRTYHLTYWLEDRSTVAGSGEATRRIGMELSVLVRACNRNSGGTGSTVEPKAKIVVVKRGPVFSKIKVVLGSRKATEPTRYKIIRDPRRGPTLRKTFNTKFKVVTYYKVRKGTVIKVRFKTKVLRYPAEA